MNDRLERVIKLYEPAGRIEAITDGGSATAADCLGRALDCLQAAELLLNSEKFEVAYTTAYDAHRGAGEAILLLNGYRITTMRGAHEATHEFAAAALDDKSSPFEAPVAATFRGGRNASEYYDPAPKTKDDAQWALDQARRACDVVASLL